MHFHFPLRIGQDWWSESENHASRLLASMNNHIFPVIGHLPVAELKPRHFIDLLKGIEQKGLLEVAARTRTSCVMPCIRE